HLEAARDVLGAGRGEQVARRAADAVRGVPRQRLVLQQLALELGLGRLGRSGRGFYARTGRASRLAVPGLAAAGSGFPTIVFSCHSWRLLTLPVRLRSAMIASHAALAADIVVVYGTRCTSAARRIAYSSACVNFPSGVLINSCTSPDTIRSIALGRPSCTLATCS